MAKLFVNDEGTVRRLRRLFINDNGVVRELKTLFTNVGGVIRKIFDYQRTWLIEGEATIYAEGLKEIVDFGVDSDFSAGAQQPEIVDFGVPNNFTSGGVSEVFDIGVDEDFSAGISGGDYIDMQITGGQINPSSSGFITPRILIDADDSTALIELNSGASNFTPTNNQDMTISEFIDFLLDTTYDSSYGSYSKVGDDTIRFTFTDQGATIPAGSGFKIELTTFLLGYGDAQVVNIFSNNTITVTGSFFGGSYTGTKTSSSTFHPDFGALGATTYRVFPNLTSSATAVLNNSIATYSISGTDLSSTITGTFGPTENATQARTRITNALNADSGFTGVWNTGTAMTVSGNVVTRFTADSAGDQNPVTLSITQNSGSNTTAYNNTVTAGTDVASFSVSGSFLTSAITGDFPTGNANADNSRDALKTALQNSSEFTNEFEHVSDMVVGSNTVTRWQSKTDTDYTPYTYSVTANGGSNATAYLNVVQNGSEQASYSIHAEGIPAIAGSFTSGANATQARIDLRDALSGDSEFNAAFEHVKDTEILSTYRDTETFATRRTDFTFDAIGNNEWALSSSRTFISNVNFSDWDDWVGNFLTYNRQISDLGKVRQIRVSIGDAVAVFEVGIGSFSNRSFEILSIVGQSGTPVNTDTELRLEVHDIGKKIARFESRTDSDQSAFTYTITPNDGVNTAPYLDVMQEGQVGVPPTVIDVTSPNEAISLTMGSDVDSVGSQIAASSTDITYDSDNDKLSTPAGTSITVSNPNTLTITRTED